MGQNQQEARLNTLLAYFIGESEEYRRLEIPERREEKRNLLRSLMNVRMPRPLPEEIRETQDAYLRGRHGREGHCGRKRTAAGIGNFGQ